MRQVREKRDLIIGTRNQFFIMNETENTVSTPFSSRGAAENELKINGKPGTNYSILTKIARVEVL